MTFSVTAFFFPNLSRVKSAMPAGGVKIEAGPKSAFNPGLAT
jgi:hypothetical protein